MSRALRPLPLKSARILATLTAGLDLDNPHRRLDNAPGSFMPCVVEWIGPNRYSVAHYFRQNGDAVADPDMEIVNVGGEWYPVAIQQVMGYSCPVRCSADGVPQTWNPRGYRDLRSFAVTFLDNVKQQQQLEVSRAAAS